MSDILCVLKGFGNGYPDALIGRPTFHWHLTGYQGNQAGYRLLLKTKKEELVWDSGWVHSRQSENVIYDGPELDFDTDFIAQLELEDDSGNRYESNREYFSTGLDSLQAKWMRPG